MKIIKMPVREVLLEHHVFSFIQWTMEQFSMCACGSWWQNEVRAAEIT
jgi:hypothetical protein